MASCEHDFKKVEYRENEYRFIEIYWCPWCGALKKKELFQNGDEKVTVWIVRKKK